MAFLKLFFATTPQGGATYMGCELSLRQRETIDSCNCSNPNIPTPKGIKPCDLYNKKRCVADVEARHIAPNDSTQISKLCRRPCWQERFVVSSTKTKRIQQRTNEMPKGTTNVLIYYEKINFQRLVEQRSYDESDFLSDTGGILGITLGLSVISCTEIVIIMAFGAYRAAKKVLPYVFVWPGPEF